MVVLFRRLISVVAELFGRDSTFGNTPVMAATSAKRHYADDFFMKGCGNQKMEDFKVHPLALGLAMISGAGYAALDCLIGVSGID